MLCTLVIMLPFIMVREFGRRFSFAHLKVQDVLTLDLSALVPQLFALLMIISLYRLSATNAYSIIGMGCALGGSLWIVRNRNSFAVNREQVKEDWRKNWQFGKWVLAERMASTLNEYLSTLLLVVLVGTAANGIFAAYISIIAIARPCLLAIGNILLPKASRAVAHGGLNELRKVISKTGNVIALMMTLFCISILFFGKRAVLFLYGNEFATYDSLIVVMSIYLFISSLGISPNYGLWAMGRSKTLFKIRMIRFGGQLPASAALALHFGVIGAAYGLLLGGIVSTAGTFWAYRAALREPGKHMPLRALTFDG
jgi:O-antigen/teichoic acid export membrane protein